MTKSTPRTSLLKMAAALIALALATGWSQSGPVFAQSMMESGGSATVPTILADPRLDLPESSFTWLAQQHDLREDFAGSGVLEAKVATSTKPAPKPTTTASKPTYSGYNRFWIPSLDMNYKVYSFPCSRTRAPDNYMYRWGCAGTNNVYILGHAYSVMKPLHDLYVAGKLRKGMVAIYADSHGRVHWYKVTSWRVVDPTDAAWAIASQPVPSMTLQTCVGKDGRYRLNVRLVQFR
jgi:sortase (surface protein transpeptidase)